MLRQVDDELRSGSLRSLAFQSEAKEETERSQSSLRPSSEHQRPNDRLAKRGSAKCSGSLWLGDADNAAGDATASVTHRLRFQVVRFCMHDDGVANDRFLATHRHHLIGQLEMRLPGSVGHQITHVAFVARRDVVTGVRIICGIEMATGGFAIGRGTITEFMDMESMFAGRKTAYIRDDFYFIARLREGDRAFHLVALNRMENSDGFGRLCGVRRGAGESENGGHHETETRAL